MSTSHGLEDLFRRLTDEGEKLRERLYDDREFKDLVDRHMLMGREIAEYARREILAFHVQEVNYWGFLELGPDDMTLNALVAERRPNGMWRPFIGAVKLYPGGLEAVTQGVEALYQQMKDGEADEQPQRHEGV